MGVVGDDVLEFDAGGGRLVFDDVKFGELDFGAGIGMIGGDPEPDFQGGVLFAERSQGFGEGHQGITVIVFGVLSADAFEERAGFGGAFEAEQGLAEVGTGIDVLGIAFEGGAIAGLGLLEFVLAEIDVAELIMVDGVIEVVDFGLEFLDALAFGGAGEFEALGDAGVAVNDEKVKDGTEDGKDENVSGPDIFAIADGVDEHPDLKQCDQPKNRETDPALEEQQTCEQRGHHLTRRIVRRAMGGNEVLTRNRLGKVKAVWDSAGFVLLFETNRVLNGYKQLVFNVWIEESLRSSA